MLLSRIWTAGVVDWAITAAVPGTERLSRKAAANGRRLLR